MEMSKNNGYTTGNLIDYEYFKDHYQLIAIDMNKQILEDSGLKQQISFIGRLEENFIEGNLLRKKKKPLLIFYKIL